MAEQVLVACNSSDCVENAKFRMEYQIVGGARGRFDWAPTFGDDNAELLAALFAEVAAVILARHALTITDEEVIILGVPAIATPAA